MDEWKGAKLIAAATQEEAVAVYVGDSWDMYPLEEVVLLEGVWSEKQGVIYDDYTR